MFVNSTGNITEARNQAKANANQTRKPWIIFSDTSGNICIQRGSTYKGIVIETVYPDANRVRKKREKPPKDRMISLSHKEKMQQALMDIRLRLRRPDEVDAALALECWKIADDVLKEVSP